MERLHSKLWLYTEFLVLVMLVPVLLYYVIAARWMLPVVWIVALYCYAVYWTISVDTRAQWWNRAAVNAANLRPILLRFGVSALVLTVLAALFAPQVLFGFVREKPALWAMIMLLYPLLSVVPQEIIFRSYFFTRYQPLFGRGVLMLAMSGISFGLSHLIFHNWVAPVLCVIGGLYFADTYRRHHSMALVSLEHALYGNFLFTLGLGRYFYHGTVVH